VRRALLVVLALTAACGSTVQTRSELTGQGLTPEQPGASLSGGTTTGGMSSGGTTGVAGSTGTTTTGGAPVVPGAPVSGPTTTSSLPSRVATHEPIQIGFVTTSVGNAQAAGVNAGQSYSDRAMYDAVVAEYNAHGGLAGHRIVPVYGNTDTASSNWSAQFAAVCATFTEDHKVKAVIGYIFVFLHSFENCLAKAHVPHLYAGYQPGDEVDQQQYPTLVSTAHPTVDGANRTALEGALSSGALTKKTKLGLLLDSCADGDRAYSRSTEPWLKAHGITYRTVMMSCAEGSGDVSSAASAVSSAELQFASNGVNLVYGSGVALFLFMTNAQTQGYQPQYVTSVGGAALQANAPADQMKNLHGFGWMPSIDTDPQHQPYPRTATQAACVAKLAKHGLHPAAYNDFMAAYATCDGLELYAQALAGSGSTSPGAIVSAVVAAMPSFHGSATYGGGLKAGPRQHGGPAFWREYGWSDACSCMTYRGATRPVPTS
jgi:ABC-type branched-subunit amino acid transport system substrate-binding protein